MRIRRVSCQRIQEDSVPLIFVVILDPNDFADFLLVGRVIGCKPTFGNEFFRPRIIVLLLS